jgi:hypothetical protein
MNLTTPEPSELGALSTDELHRHLTTAIGLTARAIANVASIWTELERRGEDLSRYKFALRGYMRAVSAGTLLPEAVASLAGQVRTLDLVASLPVPEQRRLIDGAEIEIVTGGGTTRKRLPDLTWTEAARVIRDGTVRSVGEQQLALQRSERTRRAPVKGRPRRVLVADGLMTIGTVSVELERVLSALRVAGYTVTEAK